VPQLFTHTPALYFHRRQLSPELLPPARTTAAIAVAGWSSIQPWTPHWNLTIRYRLCRFSWGAPKLPTFLCSAQPSYSQTTKNFEVFHPINLRLSFRTSKAECPIQTGGPSEARLAGVEARCWLEWGSFFAYTRTSPQSPNRRPTLEPTCPCPPPAACFAFPPIGAKVDDI